MDPDLWSQTIFGPKMTHLPKMIVFIGKTIKLIFMCLSKPLSLCKMSKKFLESIQSCEDTPFSGVGMWIFFEKTLIYFPCNSSPLSLGKISKKSLKLIQSYKDTPFLSPKWVVGVKRFFFFRKPTRKPCCIHSYLPTYRKIRVSCQSINEVFTIKEYWNLIGWEYFWP